MGFANIGQLPYNYKDQVSTVSALPTLGNAIGDLRTVQDTGIPYYWDGSAWQSLAGGGGGGGITALTGDVTASGSGSVPATVVSAGGGTGPFDSGRITTSPTDPNSMSPTIAEILTAAGGNSASQNNNLDDFLAIELASTPTPGSGGNPVSAYIVTGFQINGSLNEVIDFVGFGSTPSTADYFVVSQGAQNGVYPAGAFFGVPAFGFLGGLVAVSDAGGWVLYQNYQSNQTLVSLGANNVGGTFSGMSGFPAVVVAAASSADSAMEIQVGITDFFNGTAITYNEQYHIEPSEHANGSSGAAFTIDLSTASAQAVTITANVTFTLSNPQTGGSYLLKLVQDVTGGWTYTWPGSVHWSGGTAPTGSGANKTDLINLYYDGSIYYGSYSLNY
jgi:hypothetical protein